MRVDVGDTVAVIGAGTMGQGIAQIAAAAGQPVLLLDSRDGAAAAARERVAEQFDREVAKGRMTRSVRQAVMARFRVAPDLAALAPARLVIEAIAEDLSIKQRLFREVERVVAPDAVLTSNTSSISVTAIASILDRPQRFAGLHFFNPAPLMALVEVVSGLATDEALANMLVDLTKRWGKSPVRTRSTPGFITNRVARPFYAEALRLLQERAADPVTLDAIMREVGGYRMGPFALMDLIGNDVNFAVTLTMHRAWFGDPRYQPSVIQQELVDAGRYGRKSGTGFFDYRHGVVSPEAKVHVSQALAPMRVTIGSELDPSFLFLIAGAEIGIDRTDGAPAGISWGGLRLCLTDGRSATERALAERCEDLILYDLVPNWSGGTAVALAAADQCRPGAVDSAAAFFAGLGKTVYILADRPGMMVARTVAMFANEAADVVLQDVSTAAEVDQAMRLGANHPFGPLELCDSLGAAWVVGLLDNLATAYGEDRYRASSLLRRMAATGQRFRRAAA
jgi:3-hydroxybutyryl-CoA dehydrogenase